MKQNCKFQFTASLAVLPTAIINLQSPTGVLKEQCNGPIVYMLSTSQLSWLDVTVRREGRVVEKT